MLGGFDKFDFIEIKGNDKIKNLYEKYGIKVNIEKYQRLNP
jgi:hypothetical protein